MRVLVLEDDDATRRMLVAALGSEGWDIVSCSSTRDALEAWKEASPDVMVVDHMLGDDLTGLDFIRKCLSKVRTPVVMFSALDGPVLRNEAEGLEVTVIQKPDIAD